MALAAADACGCEYLGFSECTKEVVGNTAAAAAGGVAAAGGAAAAAGEAAAAGVTAAAGTTDWHWIGPPAASTHDGDTAPPPPPALHGGDEARSPDALMLLAASTTSRMLLLDLRRPSLPLLHWDHGCSGGGGGGGPSGYPRAPPLLSLVLRPPPLIALFRRAPGWRGPCSAKDPDRPMVMEVAPQQGPAPQGHGPSSGDEGAQEDEPMLAQGDRGTRIGAPPAAAPRPSLPVAFHPSSHHSAHPERTPQLSAGVPATAQPRLPPLVETQLSQVDAGGGFGGGLGGGLGGGFGGGPGGAPLPPQEQQCLPSARAGKPSLPAGSMQGVVVWGSCGGGQVRCLEFEVEAPAYGFAVRRGGRESVGWV